MGDNIHNIWAKMVSDVSPEKTLAFSSSTLSLFKRAFYIGLLVCVLLYVVEAKTSFLSQMLQGKADGCNLITHTSNTEFRISVWKEMSYSHSE